jgi:hypothetical protein
MKKNMYPIMGFLLPLGLLALSCSKHKKQIVPSNTPDLRADACAGLPAGFIPISTAQELQDINKKLDGNYFLCNNVNLIAIANFTPLGNYVQPFTGIFDGNGKVISSLRAYFPTQSRVGLFGSIQNAKIYNLGLENAQVFGQNQVGALVGYAVGSSIILSYTKGNIQGTTEVGGLVGYISENSAIANSYSKVHVVGNDNRVGGLVGHAYTSTTIKDTYATGDVAGVTRVGGLVGVTGQSSVVITNGYATGNVEGKDTYTGGLIGLSLGYVVSGYHKELNVSIYGSAMQNGYKLNGVTALSNNFEQTSFKNWDFSSTWIWKGNGVYPTLNMTNTGIIIETTCPGLPAGSIPILNANILQLMSQKLDGNYFLCNSLDLKGINFEPIGTPENPFTGNFDGNGKIINNLTINKPNQDYVGLFGYAKLAILKNIALENVQVKGRNNVGGLVGFFNRQSNVAPAKSTIIDSHVSGFVKGNEKVGGLAGQISNGFAVTPYVSRNYAKCDVEGMGEVGGLVGRSEITITMSHVEGNIKSASNAQNTGGLVGLSWANIEDCYVIGQVSGGFYTGGLAGQLVDRTTAKNCYTNVVTSADALIGTTGTVGGTDSRNLYYLSSSSKHSVAVKIPTDFTQQSFVGFDFNNTWTWLGIGVLPALAWQNEKPLPR